MCVSEVLPSVHDSVHVHDSHSDSELGRIGETDEYHNKIILCV